MERDTTHLTPRGLFKAKHEKHEPPICHLSCDVREMTPRLANHLDFLCDFLLVCSLAGETDLVHHRTPQRSQKGDRGESLPVRERPCEPLMVSRAVEGPPLRPVL